MCFKDGDWGRKSSYLISFSCKSASKGFKAFFWALKNLKEHDLTSGLKALGVIRAACFLPGLSLKYESGWRDQ